MTSISSPNVNIGKIATILSVSAVFLFSCTEKIDIELDSTYTRLVVEGTITTDTMPHQVKLSLTGDFFSDQPATPVSHALVQILFSNGNYQLTERTDQPGTYETSPDAFGIEGETYTLDIELQNPVNGERNYEAQCRIMPLGRLDSISLDYKPDWEVWEIKCWAQDPPTIDYYMFNVIKNNILITDTIDEVFATDDLLFNGNYTNGIGVGYLRKSKAEENVFSGDTITMQIAGITKDYTHFIWEVQSVTGYNNPLFGGTPANVRGNISNEAIGFFAAYAVKYASTIAP